MLISYVSDMLVYTVNMNKKTGDTGRNTARWAPVQRSTHKWKRAQFSLGINFILVDRPSLSWRT